MGLRPNAFRKRFVELVLLPARQFLPCTNIDSSYLHWGCERILGHLDDENPQSNEVELLDSPGDLLIANAQGLWPTDLRTARKQIGLMAWGFWLLGVS